MFASLKRKQMILKQILRPLIFLLIFKNHILVAMNLLQNSARMKFVSEEALNVFKIYRLDDRTLATSSM